MKIGFVSFIKDPWGGSEMLWSEAAHAALKARHEVVVTAVKIGLPSEPFLQLQRSGAKLLFRRGYINPTWTRRERILQKIRIWAMNMLFNPFAPFIREKPDIVVFTGASYSMLLNKSLFKLVARHQIPLLLINQVNIEYTRPINWEEAAYLKKVYRYACMSAFVSIRNLKVTERHLAYSIPQAAVLRNPVNLDSMEPVEMPSSENGYRLAIVANLLVNHKGHDILLEVLSDPKWKSRPVSLHIYGKGSDEQYIRTLIRFFDLEDRAFMEGQASDIRDVWSKNHILVMPSLMEGMPLAMVEAMICGRPVVTTDVGGHTEWIEEGVEGFIAEGANTIALDKAMERAWERRKEWKNMGVRAHERAMELHDPEPGKTLLRIILEHGHSR